jgi:hypothetical protein
VYRDKGDSFVTYPIYAEPPEISIGGATENASEALRYYRLALAEYGAAYKIRFGHYPGVNVATLHLLIAAFSSSNSERASNVGASEPIARNLLSRRGEWPLELRDDPIWHAATEGEINLLLKDWPTRYNCYRAAQTHDEFQPFHRGSMLKQVIRIVYCQKRIGVPSVGAFEDLGMVFGATGDRVP